MQRTTDAKEASGATSEQQWDLVMAMKSTRPNTDGEHDTNIKASQIPTADGQVLPVNFSPDDFKHVYLDEYTGEPIPSHLVREAIAEELTYFNEVVWDAARVEDVREEEGHKMIRTRWVICNKSDDATPDIRARLVACEVAHDKSDTCFLQHSSLGSFENASQQLCEPEMGR